jgi:hypothetical protein
MFILQEPQNTPNKFIKRKLSATREIMRFEKKRKIESPDALRSGTTNQIPPDKMTHSYNTRYQKKIREGWARLCGGHGPGDMKSVPNLSEFLTVADLEPLPDRFSYSTPGPCQDCGAEPVWMKNFERWSVVDDLCENCYKDDQ